MLPPEALGVVTTRVLLCLVVEHALVGRATVRSVARRAQRNESVIHAQLVRLRALGLVAWEPGRAATLRPLVGLVPWPSSERGVAVG